MVTTCTEPAIDEILRTIPHRPPFLFVDEIVACDASGITTRFQAKPEAAFFKGHYPGNPIMPGVLLCESVFQSAAIHLVRNFRAEGEVVGNRVPVLARIQDARFKNMMRPGEWVSIGVTLVEKKGPFYFLKGIVTRDEDCAKVLTLQCALALIDEEASPE